MPTKFPPEDDPVDFAVAETEDNAVDVCDADSISFTSAGSAMKVLRLDFTD